MKKQMRAAIAMIELIFAIVILGIVMLSAPSLISTATKSGYVALQQEAISAASAEIGMILTHYWDEGDTNATHSAPIVTTLGDSELNEINVSGLLSGRMAGTPSSSFRTFTDTSGGSLRIAATASTNLGPDASDLDDVDDFSSATPRGLTDYESTSTETGDIVDQSIDIKTTVEYISDTASYNSSTGTLTLNQPFLTASAADTSNIKMVTVNLTTSSTNDVLDKDITLRAFTCNIGTYDLNSGSL